MKYSNINLDHLIGKEKRILVTGGAGFIGSNLIIRLLKNSSTKIFNLDKLGYASNTKNIKNVIEKKNKSLNHRYKLLKTDLSNQTHTTEALKVADPDFIMHLAAESHVDRSIIYPDSFIKSNILGTFNLLNSARDHYESLPIERKLNFKFLHISTDEVYGSLSSTGSFSEKTPYDPRSPYSCKQSIKRSLS